MKWYRLGDEGCVDGEFYTFYKKELRIPCMYCPDCKQRSWGSPNARIPEPILPQAAELLAPYPPHLTQEVVLQMWERYEAEKQGLVPPHSGEEELRLLAVEPEEFFALEAELRRIYSLPARRKISPNEFIGPKCVTTKRKQPPWEAYAPAGHLYLSHRAGDELLEAGLTGIELFPVYLRSGQLSEIYEVVVTGNGGLPRLVSRGGEYHYCERCRRWYLKGEHPLKIDLDMTQWDGSDFFHLALPDSEVYISERAYDFFHRPIFAVFVRVHFHKMQGAWIHPHWDMEGNPFS